MEGAVAINFNTLQSLSEQELIDCDYYDDGCNGGFMDSAFGWINDNGGLTSDDNYPFTSGQSGQTGTCPSSIPQSMPNTEVVYPWYVDVQAGSVSAMQSAVNLTPVSIAIQADQNVFQNYASGVITGGCGQNIDHGVLLVGYGQENGVDYWLVKNSWGVSWGENGYVRIAASSEDVCGVLNAGSYPVLSKGPTRV